MKVSNELAADYLVLRAVASQATTVHCGESVGIAFSGGLDSTVLLHTAARVLGAHRCVGLHVNHGLNSCADAWRNHCIDIASQLDIVFDCRSVKITRMPQQSIEALARDARYTALRQMCEAHCIHTLWLGHHADDQAETVLLQLLRGSGLPGLAAMPLHRLLHKKLACVRPLLSVFRTSLEAYARQNALRWIDDKSNADIRYTRNVVRKYIIPTLAIYFPGYRDALARTARHAAAAQRLLQDLTIGDLSACMLVSQTDTIVKRCYELVPIGQVLSRRSLIKLSYERAINVLRLWMRQSGLATASAARVNEMLRQLRNTSNNRALRITYNKHYLCLYRNQIWWESRDNGKPIEAIMPLRMELKWSGQSVWYLPIWRGSIIFVLSNADDEQGVQCSVLRSAPLIVRSRLGGERMRLHFGGPLRTLKNLFQEAEMPTWRRHTPLLFIGDKLLWVPTLGIDPNVAGRGKVRIEWRPDILTT
ncbi:tRNA lysidine(34) synthetase TilS [Candidatus Vallotia lariciata]|uniref:tRNA lysidine(34) synthetase TilS n=1 Tax=Candidatus Vallotia laricis TaxID=2018052 RepID=UPI001D013428|nr:tRNA lysidine(34) synthetase TilS [Candidatus Vallotia lariciata]UDG83010.1 tRNA(Ile)-lysidine synthase [Candidatus Vallotia lariciata]